MFTYFCVFRVLKTGQKVKQNGLILSSRDLFSAGCRGRVSLFKQYFRSSILIISFPQPPYIQPLPPPLPLTFTQELLFERITNIKITVCMSVCPCMRPVSIAGVTMASGNFQSFSFIFDFLIFRQTQFRTLDFPIMFEHKKTLICFFNYFQCINFTR